MQWNTTKNTRPWTSAFVIREPRGGSEIITPGLNKTKRSAAYKLITKHFVLWPRIIYYFFIFFYNFITPEEDTAIRIAPKYVFHDDLSFKNKAPNPYELNTPIKDSRLKTTVDTLLIL